MKTVFMFPGQGSQQVGMGRELAGKAPEIGRLFQQANEIVGYDLAGLCFDGPAGRLGETEISQPAIFVASVACLHALRSGHLAPELAEVSPDVCAGLSLGEYTALYAAGALDFSECLSLIQVRGQCMQAAADRRRGAMVSALGLDEERANQLCAAVLAEMPTDSDGDEAVLAPVNFNCPGQIVLSGSKTACRRATELASDYGAVKAIPLRVNAAFHTSMMSPARERLQEALATCSFSALQTPVIANFDAALYGSEQEIPEKLLNQLDHAVRWQQSIEYVLDQGAERFVEIGPGRVLTGLVKKICRARKEKKIIENLGGLS